MTLKAYELHNLHPLKRAVSLGATSPISGPLVELFGEEDGDGLDGGSHAGPWLSVPGKYP